MAYERKVISSSVEKQIVTAMIVSTEFLSRTVPIIDLDFFVNDYARTVASWVLEYYNAYRKAPESDIQKIYEVNKDRVDKTNAELIASFLHKISKDYTEGQGTNDEFVYDNTLKYFDHRDMELRSNKVLSLLSLGRDEEAKEIMNKRTDLTKAVSGWETVFDRETIIKTYDEEETRNALFKMPGALGEMIGYIRRGWLIGILGGFKIGKTWMEQEFAIAGLIERAKVAFFSLEMSIQECRMRFYNRISGNAVDGSFLFPTFDCLKNQLGTCSNKANSNNVKLRESAKEKLTYVEGYTPCTYCRDNDNFKKMYVPETYFTPITIKKQTIKQKVKEVEAFESMYGNNLYYKIYPRFSAGVDDIRSSLDSLEHQEDFIPDVVVVDYADILRPSSRLAKAEPRHGIDDIWKNLAALASERHCAVITASQGTRASLKKVQKDETDLAEWIGKLGHVDVFGALNQTPIEKKKGVLRFSLLAHRHKKFNPIDNVIILQHLDTGQALLDSEFAKNYHISRGKDDEEESE